MQGLQDAVGMQQQLVYTLGTPPMCRTPLNELLLLRKSWHGSIAFCVHKCLLQSTEHAK